MDERTRGNGGRDGASGLRRRGVVVAVWVAAVGLAVGIAVVLAANAADQQADPAPAEAMGAITSIEGSTVMVWSSGVDTEPPYGALTVTISPSTRFTVHAAGALSDLHIGDNVLVSGATTGSVIVAQEIVDGGTTFEDNARGLQSVGPPPAEGPEGPPGDPRYRNGDPPVAGIVHAVDGTTFTLSEPDGTTRTVTADGSRVTVLKVSSLDALHVGDMVRVNGLSRSQDALTATSVHSRVG